MEGCYICPRLARGVENVGVRSVLMGGQGKVVFRKLKGRFLARTEVRLA